jgi:hypothetical protein
MVAVANPLLVQAAGPPSFPSLPAFLASIEPATAALLRRHAPDDKMRKRYCGPTQRANETRQRITGAMLLKRQRIDDAHHTRRIGDA